MNTPNHLTEASFTIRPLAMKLLFLAPVLATTSCGDDTGPGSPGSLQTWTLSAEPIVSIGGADEREGYLLHRVEGATRLGDGRIVVANGGTLQLRYYDPEGTHLLDAGGEGDGPGELRPPLDHFTRLPGDSVLVASFQSGFTRFGPDGQYASSIPYLLPSRGDCWSFEGNDLLPDGSHLLGYSGNSRFTDTNQPCPDPGETRPPVVIGRFIPTTDYIDTIAMLPGSERTDDPMSSLHAYPQDLVLGIARDRLYLGDTGSDEILVIGYSGDTMGVIPVPFESAPVPADAREKQFEDVELTSGELAFTERWTFIYPDHYPLYARLVAAPGDRVWVMAYPPLKEWVFSQMLTHPTVFRRLDAEAQWRIVGSDGLPIAEVRTPPGFFLLEVGDDYVLGLSKDELDRESVQLFRLIR